MLSFAQSDKPARARHKFGRVHDERERRDLDDDTWCLACERISEDDDAGLMRG